MVEQIEIKKLSNILGKTLDSVELLLDSNSSKKSEDALNKLIFLVFNDQDLKKIVANYNLTEDELKEEYHLFGLNGGGQWVNNNYLPVITFLTPVLLNLFLKNRSENIGFFQIIDLLYNKASVLKFNEDNKLDKIDLHYYHKRLNDIRVHLFSIFNRFIEIDKKTFSFFETLKSLFKDTSQDYLDNYNSLNHLSEILNTMKVEVIAIKDMYSLSFDIRDDDFSILIDYIKILKQIISVFSSIQYKLYQKSLSKEYSKEDYNTDIQLYFHLKNELSHHGDKVNKFFQKHFN